VQIPVETRRELYGRVRRHRLINQVHSRALIEMIDTFEKAGIPFQVLKETALSHLLYPDPSLHSVKDME
jgi:hypothetical protein